MEPGQGRATVQAALSALACGDWETAERNALALSGDPELASEAWRIAAAVALGRGELPVALEHLGRSLAADARNEHAWCALGQLYLTNNQPDQALQAARRAIAINPDSAAAWRLTGIASHRAGDLPQAIQAFERALDAPDAPPQSRVDLVNALLDVGAIDRAIDHAQRAVAADGEDAGAHFVHGNALAAAAKHELAAQAFARAATCDPGLAIAWHNRGLALENAGHIQSAIDAYAAALQIEPDLAPALSQMLFAKRSLCDWQDLEHWSAKLRALVIDGKSGVAPFGFLAESPSAGEQLRCAQIHARTIVDDLTPAQQLSPVVTESGTELRVGFVSSGFNNHPTALLVVDFIERLRCGTLRTYGFATTPDDGGAMRQRISAAFDCFHQAHGIDQLALAQLIRAQNIEVLIDLRGYGDGAVSSTFARRPAPLQINWLAYPGTSGAPFIDYMIADATTVPDQLRQHYSESLLRLPHCFQPSDATRTVAKPPPRAECGLPAIGVVFASFNNAWKISPQVFAAWMRILQAVPASVLWLLGDANGIAARNLRQHAERGSVAASRLIFQTKLAHHSYLALYQHIDLFLDTWPYAAHTTASDALWAGCPLLTLPGETFASRVGMSLLNTLGMPSLIAGDVDDYVDRAVALATDTDRAMALRAQLGTARTHSALFDIGRFAADFERAIGAIVARRRSGMLPADLDLAPR